MLCFICFHLLLFALICIYLFSSFMSISHWVFWIHCKFKDKGNYWQLILKLIEKLHNFNSTTVRNKFPSRDGWFFQSSRLESYTIFFSRQSIEKNRVRFQSALKKTEKGRTFKAFNNNLYALQIQKKLIFPAFSFQKNIGLLIETLIIERALLDINKAKVRVNWSN